MADNTTLNLGSGGDTLRTEDIGGGIKIPVSKIHVGADDVDGGSVTSANPFPVSGSIGLVLAGAQLSSTNPLPTKPVSGSLTGLLVGGVALASTNPLPVTSISGSQIGILMGANPVALSNPLATSQVAEAATQLISGSTVLQVYHSFGDFGVSGSANQVVAPQGGNKRIALLSAHLMAPSSVNIRWQSTGSAGSITNISGLMPLPANGGFVLPHNPHGWFKTNANEGLNLNLSSAVSCGLIITWTIFNN